MIRYVSLFSGIGAFESSLRNLKIPFELVNYSDNDKFASKSYAAIHNVDEKLNLGDITKINEHDLNNIDFITYGFPCQDISISGKQKGLFNDDGTKTRSGLFFDALRIIEHCLPKVAIAENVKNLTSAKFEQEFDIVLKSLDEAGYNNYWKVLDAKDYGLPEKRERVFIVSIRKDVDNHIFKFPVPYTLNQRLVDVLDMVVEEKFYLDSERSKALVEKLKNGYDETDKPEINVIGDLWADNGHNSMAGRVYDIKGIAPTLGASHFQQIKYIYDHVSKRIRSITPKECFRLLGFKDYEFDLAASVNSNSQLYKQIGNSIAVDVAEELLCMMFDENGNFFI